MTPVLPPVTRSKTYTISFVTFDRDTGVEFRVPAANRVDRRPVDVGKKRICGCDLVFEKIPKIPITIISPNRHYPFRYEETLHGNTKPAGLLVDIVLRNKKKKNENIL